VQLLVPRTVRRTERLGGHRADDVRGRREHLGIVEREATDCGHDLRPVDQRDALLRTQVDRLEARRLQGIGPGTPLSLIDGLAFADEYECGVRERREIAGRADAAVPRDRRVDAPIDHVAEQVDYLGPHAGSAGCERVGSEQEDRPHDILGKGWSDTDRVAPHEIPLERAKLVVRDAHRREIAETGVDAVNRIVGASDLGDDLRGLLDLPLRRSVESDRDVAARNGDHVGDGEVVAGESQGGYFRFSRYQAPSSV